MCLFIQNNSTSPASSKKFFPPHWKNGRLMASISYVNSKSPLLVYVFNNQRLTEISPTFLNLWNSFQATTDEPNALMRSYGSIVRTLDKCELPIFKDILASVYMDLETSKGIVAIQWYQRHTPMREYIRKVFDVVLYFLTGGSFDALGHVWRNETVGGSDVPWLCWWRPGKDTLRFTGASNISKSCGKSINNTGFTIYILYLFFLLCSWLVRREMRTI